MIHRQTVAFEEDAGEDDDGEDAQRVEDGSPGALAVGEAEVEESVMQCGIHHAEEQDIPPVNCFPYLEVPFADTGYD